MKRKNKADILLAFLFAAFAAATIVKYYLLDNFYINLLLFVLEAALIGGIADWFAVTALFEKPLGIPWHTAIIPNNRDSIIESVGMAVKNELISEDMIKSWVDRIDFVELLNNWLSSKNDTNPGVLIADFIEGRLEKINVERNAHYLNLKIKKKLKKLKLSNLAVKAAEYSMSNGRYKKWISYLLPKAVEYLKKDSTRENIYRMLKSIESGKENKTLFFVMKSIFNIKRKDDESGDYVIPELLQQALISLAVDLSDPDNEFYEKAKNNIAELVDTLQISEAYNSTIDSYKNGIINHIQFNKAIERLMVSIINSDARKSYMLEWISNQTGVYWEKLKNDTASREWINKTIRYALIRVVTNENHVITEIVKETMESFSDDKLNQFVKDKVGDDLQWIRINGSIVGGIFGLIVFLMMKLVLDPFVVPALHKLIQGL